MISNLSIVICLEFRISYFEFFARKYTGTKSADTSEESLRFFLDSFFGNSLGNAGLEALNAAGSVDNLVIPRVEGVAGAADFDFDLLLC